MPQIETERLLLRRFTLDDLDALTLIRGDPDVMEYIGSGHPQTREQVQAILNLSILDWEKHGFGRWAVIYKEDKKLIGWCGLKFLDKTSEIEIGCGIARLYWGKGIGTEAMAASIKHGFEELNVKCIAGVAMPENAGSRRMMEKVGMRYVKIAFYYGSSLAYYEILREEFQPTTSLYIFRDST